MHTLVFVSLYLYISVYIASLCHSFHCFCCFGTCFHSLPHPSSFDNYPHLRKRFMTAACARSSSVEAFGSWFSASVHTEEDGRRRVSLAELSTMNTTMVLCWVERVRYVASRGGLCHWGNTVCCEEAVDFFLCFLVTLRAHARSYLSVSFELVYIIRSSSFLRIPLPLGVLAPAFRSLFGRSFLRASSRSRVPSCSGCGIVLASFHNRRHSRDTQSAR